MSINTPQSANQIKTTNKISLYIHFPWCQKKCPYCDFLSYPIEPQKNKPDFSHYDFSSYVASVLCDLQEELLYLQKNNYLYQINSIYIGGGTPSLMPIDDLKKLMAGIYDLCNIASDVEISMEANPGTLTAKYCKELSQVGVKRISLGIQSFNDHQLQIIGRIHTADVAKNSCKLLQDNGFNNLNLDLMFGLPEQNLKTALYDLEQAINLQPQHISWYQFTLEPQTIFHRFPPKNMPNDEVLWKIDQHGKQLLQNNNFKQYEISAFCLEKHECQHNLNYWLFGDYIGIGVGAHGKITCNKNSATQPYVIQRYSKKKLPKIYQQAKQRNEFIQDEFTLTSDDLIGEFMLNALRLYQPINLNLFTATTGLYSEILSSKIYEAEKLELLQKLPNNHIVTTQHGRNFLTDLMTIFM